MPKKRYNAGEITYKLSKADVLLDQIFQARSGGFRLRRPLPTQY